MRTQRAKVHEAGEGNNPEVHRVDGEATIELEEPALGIWASECGFERGTNQKPLGQPIVQKVHKIDTKTGHLGANK